MGVNRIIIGNTQEMEAKQQELNEIKTLLNNIAEKSLAELRSWFDQHFSQFAQTQQDGLWVLVKAQWASAKALKKIWKIVENIKTN